MYFKLYYEYLKLHFVLNPSLKNIQFDQSMNMLQCSYGTECSEFDPGENRTMFKWQ